MKGRQGVPEGPGGRPIERFLTSLITLLLRRPLVSILVLSAMTAASLGMGSKLAIRTNMEDLFPESTPHVSRAREVREMLGFSSQIKVIIGSPDRETNIRFLNDLAARIQKHPEIKSVEYRRDISFFRKNALLFLPLEDLLELEQEVKSRIKAGVARALDPFGDETSDSQADKAGDPPDLDEDFSGDSAGLDEDFGDSDLDEDFGDSPKATAGPESGKVPESGLRAESDDGGLAIPDEEEIKRRYGMDQFSEYFISPDGTVAGLKIFPTISPNEVEDSKVLLGELSDIIKELDPASYHKDLVFAMEGDYHKKIEEMEIIKKDLSKSTLVAGGLVLLLIILYFGKLRAILFVLFPLLTGVAWTMGMAWLSVGYLNLITTFIFAIMFGLGVDFSIHATSRYLEERGRGMEVVPAVVAGISNLGRPMISAAVTTSVTFFSLAIFEFRGFSQFGIIAGVGVLMCFLAVILVLPPLIVLSDRVFKEKVGGFAGAVSRVPGFARNRRAAAVTLGVTVVVFAGLGLGLDRIYFDPDMAKIMTKTKKTQQELLTRYRRQVESRSMSPIIVPTGSLEESRKVQEYLRENKKHLPTLEDFASIWSFIPDGQEEKLAVVERIRTSIRKKRAELTGKAAEDADKAEDFLSPAVFSPQDLPEWVRSKFTDKQGNLGNFVLMYAHLDKNDASDVELILKDLDTLKVDGKEYYSTASYYIVHDAFEIVKKEGPLAMLLAAMAVLLVLFLDIRKPKLVFLTFISLPFGLLAFLGLSGFLGWNLNIFNMVILPTLFGIGIDTSIHLVHRSRDAGREGIGGVIASTGSAAGMSSATTAAGFASMMVATNPGLESIGTAAPVGIFLCYLASIGLTGSLLWLWGGRNNSKGDTQ